VGAGAGVKGGRARAPAVVARAAAEPEAVATEAAGWVAVVTAEEARETEGKVAAAKAVGATVAGLAEEVMVVVRAVVDTVVARAGVRMEVVKEAVSKEGPRGAAARGDQ
jgi:hypothetical protein